MEGSYFNQAQGSRTATTTLSGTPRAHSPDSDPIERAPHNPFATPYAGTPYGGSIPASAVASTTGFQSSTMQAPPAARYFHSRRIVKGQQERPWLNRKDPKEKWVTIIPLIGIAVGLALSGFLIYDGLQSVHHHTYCPVYEDDFSSGSLNEKIWTKEVEVGGYGNGQFEYTTGGDENVFIKDGMLTIKPTLQDAKLIETNNILNLTQEGICTSDVWSNCVTSTNNTNGSIINPVKSARINTKGGASIKYGRVEVLAKLPAGDWLWPAIWMMPVKDTYGPWPASGEIDIMESRGNNYTYTPQGGNNIVSSTLHWGPDPANDQWWQNNNKREALHETYANSWHTFGLEWSEKYIFTYIDTRLLQVMYTNFNKPFWDKASVPPATANGTAITNPWATSDSNAAPFNEDFFLILNVAVGGTNGWFEDGINGKPWVDSSDTAKKEFWQARDQWYPTWEKNGQMQVKSVKMYQQKGYNGCN